MPAPQPSPSKNRAIDLIAFLAVLATGVALVCIGGVHPDALAGVAVGLAYVYAVWADRSRQRESSDEHLVRDEDRLAP
ncbi:hypothetical protein [Streptomyces violascens]|uniref:Uncharacterized protein n=1 Tax=Streptomyces violascens TaxID=67381 RepID=A0ABQ3QET9_9ACTN|nr:hypothetical protein [Streptomyces violascens]GGU46649.1 hypothetical protein GCM10010289_78860 [Streptomyces violascens]GHI35804.1 hypothetical protein Sviol_02120 [Streptomyces violascens]GHI39939.1 hypothetical protein Sviol_43470 [Streptomyces violascens]